jgi:CheY-like chemotaxis protein
MEAGKMDIEVVSFKTEEIITEVVQTISFNAKKKALTIDYLIDSDIPQTLMGDPTRLKQILLNFGSNAVKFTEQGNVTIHVSLIEKEGDSCNVKFSVKDTGLGIPEDKLDGIFDPFKQADTSTTRKYGGTGLGLAICSQIVELMHGSIGVESEPGEGSAFWFKIPLKQEKSDLYANENPDSLIDDDVQKKFKEMKILVVEDDKMNQLVVQKFLEKEGLSVDIAETGREAIKAIESTEYGVVLMDVQMPDMGGYEATEIIREKENGTGRHVPIIMLTASAMAEDREQSIDAGADDFITKPIDKTRLINAILEHTDDKTRPRKRKLA